MQKYGDLFYAMLYIFLQYVSVINKPIANAKKSFLVIVVSVSYSIGLDHTPIEPLPIVMDTLREVANQKKLNHSTKRTQNRGSLEQDWFLMRIQLFIFYLQQR